MNIVFGQLSICFNRFFQCINHTARISVALRFRLGVRPLILHIHVWALYQLDAALEMSMEDQMKEECSEIERVVERSEREAVDDQLLKQALEETRQAAAIQLCRLP